MSEVETAYTAWAGGDINLHSAKRFVSTQVRLANIDMSAAVRSIHSAWRSIERSFFERMTTLFNIALPSAPLTCFITLDTRCTYSIASNYFYVYWNSKHPCQIIMHEVFHFFTWYGMIRHKPQLLLEPGYNEIKEGLTVLINESCRDLLGGDLDKGYPRHAKLRAGMLAAWRESRDIYKIIDEAMRSL